MIQWDLQVVMLRIWRHLWIETSGAQAGRRHLKKRLILMQDAGSTAEYNGQEQYDANPGQRFFLKPAN